MTFHSKNSLDSVKIIMFQVEREMPEMSIAIHFRGHLTPGLAPILLDQNLYVCGEKRVILGQPE